MRKAPGKGRSEGGSSDSVNQRIADFLFEVRLFVCAISDRRRCFVFLIFPV